MAFDISTARPVKSRFDISTAKPIEIEKPPLQFKSIKEAQIANTKAQRDVEIAKSRTNPILTTLEGLSNTADQINRILPFGDRTMPLTPRNIAGEGLKTTAFIPGVGPLVGGAAYGTGEAIKDESKSIGGIATQAALGAAGGKIGAKVIEKVSPIVGGFLAKPFKSAQEKFQGAVDNFTQIISPSSNKFKQTWQINKYKKDAGTVVEDIVQNKQNYKFENPDTGQIEVRLPKSRWEVLSVSQDNKKAIWNGVESKLKQATKEGATVNYGKIADDIINPLLKNEQLLTHEPTVASALVQLKDRIALNQSRLTPTQAQEELKYLNNLLDTYYKNPSLQDVSITTVRAALSKRLRDATDNAVEKALGQGGYKKELSRYSAYKNLEGDFVKAAARQATGKDKSSFLDPVADAWASGEIIGGLVSGHPGMVAKGVGWVATKGAIRKYFHNPDVGIEKSLNAAEKQYLRLNPKNPVGNLQGMNPTGVGQLYAQPPVTFKPTTEKPTLRLPSPLPKYLQERQIAQIPSLGVKGNPTYNPSTKQPIPVGGVTQRATIDISANPKVAQSSGPLQPNPRATVDISNPEMAKRIRLEQIKARAEKYKSIKKAK